MVEGGAEVKEEPMEHDGDSDKEDGDSASDSDSEEDATDEEDLMHDSVKVREAEAKRKERRRAKEKQQGAGKSKNKSGVRIEGESSALDGAEFFEEYRVSEATQEDASFYNMNLSRPLLKAIEALRSGQQTVMQACDTRRDDVA